METGLGHCTLFNSDNGKCKFKQIIAGECIPKEGEAWGKFYMTALLEYFDRSVLG